MHNAIPSTDSADITIVLCYDALNINALEVNLAASIANLCELGKSNALADNALCKLSHVISYKQYAPTTIPRANLQQRSAT